MRNGAASQNPSSLKRPSPHFSHRTPPNDKRRPWRGASTVLTVNWNGWSATSGRTGGRSGRRPGTLRIYDVASRPERAPTPPLQCRGRNGNRLNRPAIQGRIARELKSEEYARWPERPVGPAHPFLRIDAFSRRCNRPYKNGGGDADAARRRRRYGGLVTNAHGAKLPFEYLAVDTVTIADDVPWHRLPAAGLGKLPGDPLGRRALRSECVLAEDLSHDGHSHYFDVEE
jgi:hypothetical protein